MEVSCGRTDDLQLRGLSPSTGKGMNKYVSANPNLCPALTFRAMQQEWPVRGQRAGLGGEEGIDDTAAMS